jgi:hypothetical protein
MLKKVKKFFKSINTKEKRLDIISSLNNKDRLVLTEYLEKKQDKNGDIHPDNITESELEKIKALMNIDGFKLRSGISPEEINALNEEDLDNTIKSSVTGMLLGGMPHEHLDEFLTEEDYVKMFNPLVKYNFDKLPGVVIALYNNIEDRRCYCQKNSGNNIGRYFHVADHFDEMDSKTDYVDRRSGKLIISAKHGSSNTHIIRISDISTVEMQHAVFSNKSITKLTPINLNAKISKRSLFLVNVALTSNKQNKVSTLLIVDLFILKRIIELMAYSESEWLYDTLTDLQVNHFMIEKDKMGLVPMVMKEYKQVVDTFDEEFNKSVDIIRGGKPVKFGILNSSTSTTIQQLTVSHNFESSNTSHINIILSTEYFKVASESKVDLEDEAIYDKRFNTYVVLFKIGDDGYTIAVDEDLINNAIRAMVLGGKDLDDFFPKNSLSDIKNDDEPIQLMQSDLRINYKKEDDRRISLEASRKKKSDRQEAARLQSIKDQRIQQSLDWKKVHDITNIGYLSNQDKIDNYLDLIDLTDEEVVSLKNGEGDYFKVFEYIEKPESFDFSFSSYDPEPINLEDEYDLISIDEDVDVDELDSMVHVEAAPVWTGEHIGEGSSKERDAARIKTLRVIKGKKNCMVGYPAGAVIPGRMRMTWCNRVVVEPAKGDTAALVFKYDDVSDIINNGKVLRLASIPHERIIHIGKGIDLLATGFNYINPNDWI